MSIRSQRITSLHVVPSLDEAMGGSVQAALSMCEALSGIGVEARIASTAGASDRLRYLDSEFAGIRYVVFPRLAPRHYYRSRGLHAWIRTMPEVDVLHVHGVFNFPAAYALSASDRSTRLVVSPHGQLDPYDLATHHAAKRLYGELFLRRVLPKVDHVIVTSTREAAVYESFGASIETTAIPLPVKPGAKGCGARLRRRYGIESETIVLLFLGRIHPKKRLDIVFASIARLRTLLPRIHLLLVGEGDSRYTRSMRELASRLDLGRSVTWAGTLRGDEKADAFDAAALFILPSENENFGITVVEALLAGLPTLVSDQVDVHPTVAKYGLGAVCQPELESCSNHLGELLRDPARLRLISERARSVARSLFSPDAVAARLREIYVSPSRQGHDRA